ncbi:hypothetical protein ACWDBF_21350 [Streptomyces angustmyceticus]
MSLTLISAALDAYEADTNFRPNLVNRYVTARDWAEQLRYLAAATRYDKGHPDEPSLYEELLSTQTGDTYEIAA